MSPLKIYKREPLPNYDKREVLLMACHRCGDDVTVTVPCKDYNVVCCNACKSVLGKEKDV